MATYNKNAIAAYFSKKMQINFDNYGAAMQCVNRKHESELKDGDTLYIQKYGDITINDGDTIRHDNSSITQITFPIDQIKNFSVPIGKIDKKQANINLQAGWDARTKVAMGLTRDTRILSHVAQASSDNTLAQFAATKNNIYEYCTEAFEKLSTSNALDDQGKCITDGKPPWMIINPAIRKLMVNSPQFTPATSMGDKVVRKAMIGEFAGFDILVSTNFAASSGVYNVMFGTNDAITYVSQMDKVRVIEENKDDWYIYLQGLFVYGSKVENDSALGKMPLTIA